MTERRKSPSEYALERKWRERLMGGASAADFRAAYDEIHALFLSERAAGSSVYNPHERKKVDWTRRAILSRVPSGSRVLDIGGGEGDLALLLASAGNRVVSADVSGVIVERARRVLALKQDQCIRFGQADARELPFSDRSFDYVVSEDLLEHLPQGHLSRHLDEVRRVLRGGCYIAASPSRLAVGRQSVGFHLRLYTLGELSAAFRASGLSPAWMDPRILRRLGKRLEVQGGALRAACWLERMLEALGLARWPAAWRSRLAPKPLLCGYPK